MITISRAFRPGRRMYDSYDQLGDVLSACELVQHCHRDLDRTRVNMFSIRPTCTHESQRETGGKIYFYLVDDGDRGRSGWVRWIG